MIPAGYVKLKSRMLLVSYNLLTDCGIHMGAGTSRIECSNADSMVKQLNLLLSGRRYKITEVIPVT